jgi:hypothetical protein
LLFARSGRVKGKQRKKKDGKIEGRALPGKQRREE